MLTDKIYQIVKEEIIHSYPNSLGKLKRREYFPTHSIDKHHLLPKSDKDTGRKIPDQYPL